MKFDIYGLEKDAQGKMHDAEYLLKHGQGSRREAVAARVLYQCIVNVTNSWMGIHPKQLLEEELDLVRFIHPRLTALACKLLEELLEGYSDA